jgi:hypothetical protein
MSGNVEMRNAKRFLFRRERSTTSISTSSNKSKFHEHDEATRSAD